MERQRALCPLRRPPTLLEEVLALGLHSLQSAPEGPARAGSGDRAASGGVQPGPAALPPSPSSVLSRAGFLPRPAGPEVLAGLPCQGLLCAGPPLLPALPAQATAPGLRGGREGSQWPGSPAEPRGRLHTQLGPEGPRALASPRFPWSSGSSPATFGPAPWRSCCQVTWGKPRKEGKRGTGGRGDCEKPPVWPRGRCLCPDPGPGRAAGTRSRGQGPGSARRGQGSWGRHGAGRLLGHMVPEKRSPAPSCAGEFVSLQTRTCRLRLH